MSSMTPSWGGISETESTQQLAQRAALVAADDAYMRDAAVSVPPALTSAESLWNRDTGAVAAVSQVMSATTSGAGSFINIPSAQDQYAKGTFRPS